MIKKTFHLLLFIYTVTNNAVFATSSMAGINKNGYFDDDNIVDTIKCEQSKTSTYNCVFKLSSNNFKKNLKIINNNECSEFSIDNTKIGEITLSCGVWGINRIYYYDYDAQKLNWYLSKYIYEELPMDGPNDIGKKNTYKKFSKKWSIDDGLLKPEKDVLHSLELKICLDKQPLYKSPCEASKTKMYLVKGDNVELVEEKDGWLHIIYHGKKDIDAWIPKDSVE